jgi:hypothetical protein
MLIPLIVWLVLTYALVAVNHDSMPDSIYAKRVRDVISLLAAISFVFVVWLAVPVSWPFWLRCLVAVVAIPIQLVAVTLVAFRIILNIRMRLSTPPLLRYLIFPLYLRHSGGLAGVTRLVFRPHKGCVAVGSYPPSSLESALTRHIQQSLPHLRILSWNEYLASAPSSDATAFANYMLTTCMGLKDVARLDIAMLTADGYDASADRYLSPKSAFTYGGNRGVENNMFDETIEEAAGAFCDEYQRLNPLTR